MSFEETLKALNIEEKELIELIKNLRKENPSVGTRGGARQKAGRKPKYQTDEERIEARRQRARVSYRKRQLKKVLSNQLDQGTLDPQLSPPSVEVVSTGSSDSSSKAKEIIGVSN